MIDAEENARKNANENMAAMESAIKELENLKRERTQLRRLFSRACALLEEELQRDNPGKVTADTLLKQVEDKSERLTAVDSKIFTLLLETARDTEYEKDYETAESYRDRVQACRAQHQNFREGLHVSRRSSGNSSRREDISELEDTASELKKKLRLPKLELSQFDGDVKKWIGFWGMFRKIDEDTEMRDEDKFQYLLQSTVPNSKARKLVESFPPSAANYREAVTQLKTRFARDELLIQVYVRDLLNLVVRQVTAKSALPLDVLFDQLETHLRALGTLGMTKEKFAAGLYPMVESALPEEVLKLWQRHRSTLDRASPEHSATQPDTSPEWSSDLTRLMEFLRAEVEGEQRVSLARNSFGGTRETNHKARSKQREEAMPTAAALFSSEVKSGEPEVNKKPPCIFCDRTTHAAQDCLTAQKMTLEERRETVVKKKACFRCLKRTGHQAKKCRFLVRCVLCSKEHFVLLCPELPTQTGAQTTSEPKVEVLLQGASQAQVLLQTILVKMKHKNRVKVVRALLDQGSQRSYIAKQCAEELKLLKVQTETVTHGLFGGVETDAVSHALYNVELCALDGGYSCSVPVLDQDVICTPVPRLQEGSLSAELKQRGISVSDVGQGSPTVELLLGADVLGDLLTGRIEPVEPGLVAIETRLGWALMGRPRCAATNHVLMSITLKNTSLSEMWSLETLGIKDPVETLGKQLREQEVLRKFSDTVTTDLEGRYQVKLPWLEGHPELSDNRDLAMQRLTSMSRRLVSRDLLVPYRDVLNEWKAEGIIEEIDPERDDGEGPRHYLPHRPVLKESSQTTKIRPVFDASAKSRDGWSLNDCLETGPNLIELIPSVLARFRYDQIGVVSDIKRAFLQIGVDPSDRDCLRFLWWGDFEKREVKIFKHTRVVFGVSSSPFLLAATISHHLAHIPDEMKSTALRLKGAFYVDNCVTSVADEGELKRFMAEAKHIMALGRFELRGWVHTHIEQDVEGAGGPPEIPVLGLLWDPCNDVLSCDLHDLDAITEFPSTKRGILSLVQRVFDPIGFTCPVTLLLKLILREAWQSGVAWDQPLDENILKKCREWTQQIQWLSLCKVPRCLGVPLRVAPGQRSIHMFCDASQNAYAACVFLRCEANGEVSVQLVQAKSRVAPLRPATIPRLELLAAVVGARIYHNVAKDLELRDCPAYFWCDSAVVVFWIKHYRAWGVFVENRVREIRTLTNVEDWRHVPGDQNAADLPSRGCSAKTLHDGRWWEGPKWLHGPPELWPQSTLEVDEQEINRERRGTAEVGMVSCSGGDPPSQSFRHISRYTKIVRTIAWVKRFVFNTRHSTDRRSGELLAEEIEGAELSLLGLIQRESFGGVEDRTIQSLQPFVDEHGLIRIRSRLALVESLADFRFPILLPSNHYLVQRLIEETHRRMLHASVQTLRTYLRETYWILKSRRTIRCVVSRCVRCKRHAAVPVGVPCAPLPKERLISSLPFEKTGIDFAGPLWLKDQTKVWIVLFTCATYRAVHLELTPSLSTGAFLMTLRRFIARRGRPDTIFCDNGTNFRGAYNELKGIHWERVSSACALQRIRWHFSPPTAAWWGGWWERLIGLLKSLLRRNLGRASLYFEELSTIMCECEAVMNARPLTYVSQEPLDLAPLTPSLFLQPVINIETADIDKADSQSLRKRGRYVQRVREGLRTRFKREYLSELVHQGARRQQTIGIGDVVLVGSDVKKRIDWPLGLVLRLYPGRDGVPRVALLRTATGEITRPLQRLYPLEVSSDALQNSGDGDLGPGGPAAEECIQCEDELETGPLSQEKELRTREETVGPVTRRGRPVKVPRRLDL